MEFDGTYLPSLGVLFFASVVLLSLIGTSSFAVYLGLIPLSYFADSFTPRPRRKSVVVGVVLLALFRLLVIAEVL
jgi:amino acid permease